jgi:hypothetical protein
MKFETMRDQVRTVAERWRDTYKTYRVAAEGFVNVDGIQRGLNALDAETATAVDVAAIIGNSSWVCAPKCDECNEHSWSCVEIGEPADYDSSTATVCIECLRKAVALLEANDAQG